MSRTSLRRCGRFWAVAERGLDMRFVATSIPGLVVVEADVHRDERGFFLETFHAARYASAGIPAVFAQDNHSSSVRGTIRGLHLQKRKPQGKLVRVVAGAIWDVAVDVRRDSPTLGRWAAEELTADNFKQLYVPPGCAHGFCVLSDTADVLYRCTELYDATDELGIAYNDPALAIPWPVSDPILSSRDRQHPPFHEVLAHLHADTTP
jgi:dTDP-4-dehydrorhamnose 3,5-epimerase